MKQLNLLPIKALMILFSFFMVSCGDDENEEPKAKSATELLTNGSSKSWYLAAQTPEEEVASCKATSPQSLDNTYTYHADGTFILDNGQIHEDPECQDAGCCSDPVSIVGTWKFLNDEKEIEIYAEHKKGDPNYVLDEVLFTATIQILEENELVLSDAEYTVEFRPRSE